MRFDDQVAVITGAGDGLGKQYALLLASRGARVARQRHRRFGDRERARTPTRQPLPPTRFAGTAVKPSPTPIA